MLLLDTHKQGGRQHTAWPQQARATPARTCILYCCCWRESVVRSSIGSLRSKQQGHASTRIRCESQHREWRRSWAQARERAASSEPRSGPAELQKARLVVLVELFQAEEQQERNRVSEDRDQRELRWQQWKC